MNWEEHLSIGFIVGVIAFFVFYFTGLIELGFKQILFLAVLIAFFSLAPDLDIQSSKPRQIVTVLGLMALLYFNFIAKVSFVRMITISLLIIWGLPLIPGFGHRGHYHSLLFGILICLPIYFYFSWIYAVIGLCAFLSHLFADDGFKLW